MLKSVMQRHCNKKQLLIFEAWKKCLKFAEKGCVDRKSVRQCAAMCRRLFLAGRRITKGRARMCSFMHHLRQEDRRSSLQRRYLLEASGANIPRSSIRIQGKQHTHTHTTCVESGAKRSCTGRTSMMIAFRCRDEYSPHHLVLL